MPGKWCITPMKEREKSRYRYDFIKPFNTFLEFASEKTGQDYTSVTPHVMRHTFASILINNGISLTKVSIWMGYDMRTTRRHYAHLIKGDRSINALRTNYKNELSKDCLD
jgi:site-specific recombinase XerD